MCLFDLAPELVQQISDYITLSRELPRVMRLRLVCHGFKHYIDDAIFRLRYLDQFSDHPYFINMSISSSRRTGRAWASYLYSYLAYQAAAEQGTGSRLGRVYHAAQTLCRQEDNSGREAFSTCLTSLLRLAALNDSASLFEEQAAEGECPDSDLEADVCVAAIYLGRTAFVENQIARGLQVCGGVGALDLSSVVFGNAFEAATRQGDLAMIKLLLSYTSEFRATGVIPELRRDEILTTAGAAGHRAAFEFALEGGCPLDPSLTDTRPREYPDRWTLVQALRSTPCPDQFEQTAAVLGPANNIVDLQGPEALAHWLFRSVAESRVEMTHYFLARGAAINPPVNYRHTSRLSLGQVGHYMALLYAAQNRDEETMGILLTAGADPDWYSPFNTPLMAAAWKNSIVGVRLLLDSGADVNKGYPPPIVIAVVKENLDMFCLLRQRGAILDTPETGGWAMGLARLHGLDSMVDLLVGEGLSEEAILQRAAHEGEAYSLHYIWPLWARMKDDQDDDNDSDINERIDYSDAHLYVTDRELDENNGTVFL